MPGEICSEISGVIFDEISGEIEVIKLGDKFKLRLSNRLRALTTYSDP